MTISPRTLLLIVPPEWVSHWEAPLKHAAPWLTVLVQARDAYEPGAIDYALSFRPPPGLLASLPNLKAVFSLGAGVDGFLSDPAYPRHVPLVRFVSESLSREMVQYVVLQTLMHHRQSAHYAELQKQHEWHPSIPSRPTAQTRIGLLGMGEIGRRAAAQLRDLGFAVAGWSNTSKEISGVESFAGETALASFLARTDILICLLPLTPQTRGILNAETFAQLPRGAIVINAARGAHLVERDLLAALESGHLSGASLDVFEIEPLPADSPLWPHPKVIVTPHIAGISDPQEASRYVADNIARQEGGEALENVVDPARGH